MAKKEKKDDKKDDKKADAKDDKKADAKDDKEEKKDDAKEEKKDDKKDAKDEKKDDKKDAKDEKKDAKADAKEEKKDDKKDDKEEKKDEKKDDKKDDKEEKKDDKKDDKEEKKEGEEGDEKKDEKKDEEKKEEKKAAKPGEENWDGPCKDNEWEAADGNCAFEAESLAQKTANSILVQTADLDSGMQFVQLENGSGLWMKNRREPGAWVTKADEEAESAARIATTDIESVKGPPGAPIGFGVHRLSIDGGEPYAAKEIYRADAPANGVQHQPIIMPMGFYPTPRAVQYSPSMQYRVDMREKGVRAADANLDKIIAAGMTETPKARFDNSILVDELAKNKADDAKANGAVKGDVNGGATDRKADSDHVNKVLNRMAKDAPNPKAAAADPSTDPAAVAAAANAGEAPKAAPAAAFAQEPEEDPTKIESVRGPPGAPLGYGVHKLSVEGGNPYAAKQMYRAEAPVNGIQHQPIIMPEGFYPPVTRAVIADPNEAYRRDVGEKGVKADTVKEKDILAAGMSPEPKHEAAKAGEVDEEAKAKADDAKANKGVKGDVNGGATDRKASADHVDKVLKRLAKDAPNPNAKAADPSTDPAAVAKAANAGEAPVAAAKSALMQKQDSIGEPKYDWDVYRFSHNAIYDPLQASRIQEGGAPSMNGYAAPAWSLAQKNPKAKNIGDKQIDEEVVGFVRADKNTNPIQDRRRDEAWPINGWANTPPSKVLSQRNSKDIGDKNIDEEVVGFVRADKNTDPVRSYSREQPWPVNGWSNTPPSKALA